MHRAGRQDAHTLTLAKQQQLRLAGSARHSPVSVTGQAASQLLTSPESPANVPAVNSSWFGQGHACCSAQTCPTQPATPGHRVLCCRCPIALTTSKRGQLDTLNTHDQESGGGEPVLTLLQSPAFQLDLKFKKTNLHTVQQATPRRRAVRCLCLVVNADQQARAAKGNLSQESYG